MDVHSVCTLTLATYCAQSDLGHTHPILQSDEWVDLCGNNKILWEIS